MANKAKAKYKITNWAKHNKSLVERGSITFWFSDDALAAWQPANDEVRRGRPTLFSDVAIETVLVLRELLQLPYRQTEGFARSLIELMKVDVAIPDYTLLCKRAKALRIDLKVGRRRGPINVVVDSTGLKVFGEGEWKVRSYGTGKRRTWRKLHLAIDPETQEILAECLTGNSGYDADQVEELLEAIPSKIDKFFGDGGYDKWKVYGLLEQRGIAPVIPPQHNAKIKQHGNTSDPPLARDEAIRRIRQVGRRRWRQEVGYHQRSLAEMAMYRVKTIFGDTLKNRTLPNQKTEARLRCKILNRFKQGLPDSTWN